MPFFGPLNISLISAILLALCAMTVCKISKPRIAIIGAGIGGTSSAYFMRDLFGEETVIDLYEKGEIGGRLATVKVAGNEYESGGSIIHPKNEYMVNFTKLLGLKQRDDSPDGRLGIYDGEKMVFDGSSNTLVMVAQLFWRYGLDIYRIGNYVSELLSHFGNIYPAQEAGESFTTPEKLLGRMAPGFPDKLRHSVREELRDAGLSQRFIDELVMGGLRTNYGQGTNIHGFVGAVSMAGVEHGLWRVHGGNKLVPEKLLDAAKVNLIKGKVVKVTLKAPEGQTGYTVVSQDAENPKKISQADYDIVILASPLHSHMTDIKFENFPKPIGDFPQKFHRTVANFVKGTPRSTTFGLSEGESIPTELLTSNQGLFFNSIGKHLPVTFSKGEKDNDGKDAVFKVFSPEPLNKEQLDELFVTYEEVEVVDWLAYPTYTQNEVNIPPFELYHQLYYVNGIELCASAMEMSVIGARNVALLSYNHWYGRLAKVDPKPAPATKLNSEL